MRRAIINYIFPNEPEKHETYLSNLDEVILTLDERQQCALQKRLKGESYKKIGSSLINLGIRKNYSDGVSAERARHIYIKAVRQLTHPTRKKVFMGELSSDEYLKNKYCPIEVDSNNKLLFELNGYDENKLKTESYDDFLKCLSVRSYNCLKNNNIMSFSELFLLEGINYVKMKGFGRKSLNEVREVLKLNYGLT